MSLSRRALIHTLFRPLKAGGAKASSVVARMNSPAVPPVGSAERVVVIQGRYCLAYTEGYCSVCYERCPVPQAIELGEGLPRIIAETCTGCGICHEVCPAPKNAILIVPRKPVIGASPAA